MWLRAERDLASIVAMVEGKEEEEEEGGERGMVKVSTLEVKMQTMQNDDVELG